ncbi:MAG: hydantoinase B/oxoprolinase family protein, partial [Armatimonadota bacterium]
ARLRLLGTETPLEIEPEPGRLLSDQFSEAFAAIHGAWRPGRPIEVESLRVFAGVAPEPIADTPGPRAGVPVGGSIDGPRVLAEPHGTTWVPPGWRATVDAAGALVLRRLPGSAPERSAAPEAVARELFARRFEAIATDMGEMLRRTALSVNVKERLDYSCALLGPDGALVATAAHIPVHLGALGICVRRLIETVDCGPGTEWVVNHPAWGGSHLPDITVVTPVHDDLGHRLGFVASRAHHAEIGGTRPGSMPPGARTLAEEGVALPPTPADPETLAAVLSGGPFPSRSVSDNLADLEAQRAANRHGGAALRRLAEVHGAQTLGRHRVALADHAARLVRDALRARGAGVHRAEAHLDDGHAVRVAVTLPGDGTAVVDFAGTDSVHPGNFNAPPAVVRAAVLTVVRMLVAEPVPLNEGLLDAVEIRIPAGSFLNPTFTADPTRCPAVVGGNTETSQRIVAALVRALGLCADSQGTMNNVLFGNERFGYYETVCGGAGAAEGVAGASAVHTWMTNTRITDPEILETRLPVRLERFAIRRGSGGAGRWPGGDGAVREIRFLEPLSLSVLAQSRVCAPAGGGGGSDGAPGRQTLVRGDGTRLEGVVAAEVEPGDWLILETPGGGGWGPAA